MGKQKGGSAQLAVVISDIHCGSEVALSPPFHSTRAGNSVTFGENHHQKWLWECWAAAILKVQSIIAHDQAILILNGDAIEGCHHRNNAELVEQEKLRQTEMAQTCLLPFLKLCRQRYVVKGTECHTEDFENHLAREIRAVGNKARDKWLIEVNGTLIDAAHHMGVTSRAYLEASLMSIHMGNARLNYARCGMRIPQVFLRGHRHCGGHFSDMEGMFVVTGAWQFLTRHGFKVVTDSIPRPSIAVLDWRGKEPGELPQIHEIKFDPPLPEIARA